VKKVDGLYLDKFTNFRKDRLNKSIETALGVQLEFQIYCNLLRLKATNCLNGFHNGPTTRRLKSYKLSIKRYVIN
jgi:hypothetical protein